MGEKRAYKAREPGGGRKKLKPEYDAGKNLKEQMDTAVVLYGENCSLQSIADSLDLNPIKIRKLLITTGVYFPSTAAKLFCCSSKGKRTFTEYYGAAEPPVRCGESHLSGLTEPPHFIY